MEGLESATAQAVEKWAGEDPDITGATIASTDAVLHSRWDSDVDWIVVHATSVGKDATVASIDGPYWVDGLPITTLAFWGAPERARIASDMDTPRELAALLACDPDRTVAHLAAARLRLEARPAFIAPPTARTTAPGAASTTSDLSRLSDLGRGTPIKTRSRNPVGTVFATLFIIAAIAGTTFAVAVSTAVRWTATDIPAQAETFRAEAYYTGSWIVCDGYSESSNIPASGYGSWRKKVVPVPGQPFSDQSRTAPITCLNTATVTDSSRRLCHSGQDWTDCINDMVDEYNRECTRSPLTDESRSLCKGYKTEINRMKKEDGPGYVVETVGDGYNYLRSDVEIDFRQVSNNDYRPAVTHEAVCYLGVFGECPKPGDGTQNR